MRRYERQRHSWYCCDCVAKVNTNVSESSVHVSAINTLIHSRTYHTSKCIYIYRLCYLDSTTYSVYRQHPLTAMYRQHTMHSLHIYLSSNVCCLLGKNTLFTSVTVIVTDNNISCCEKASAVVCTVHATQTFYKFLFCKISHLLFHSLDK